MTVLDTLDHTDVPLGHGLSLPHAEVIRRLRFLPEAERLVMVLRRGLAGPPRSIGETAVILGLCPEEVAVVEAMACARLRHPSFGGGHRP